MAIKGKNTRRSDIKQRRITRKRQNGKKVGGIWPFKPVPEPIKMQFITMKQNDMEVTCPICKYNIFVNKTATLSTDKKTGLFTPPSKEESNFDMNFVFNVCSRCNHCIINIANGDKIQPPNDTKQEIIYEPFDETAMPASPLSPIATVSNEPERINSIPNTEPENIEDNEVDKRDDALEHDVNEPKPFIIKPPAEKIVEPNPIINNKPPIPQLFGR